jgi:dGTPase
VKSRYLDVDDDRLHRELVRDQIGLMVNDVIAETRRRLREVDPVDVEEVRDAGRPLAGFSAEVLAEEAQLKSFLYARMYRSPEVVAVAGRAQALLSGLFAAYRKDPGLLPGEWRRDWISDTEMLRTIGDFVAGMTDRYAITQYELHVGPAELPEGF